MTSSGGAQPAAGHIWVSLNAEACCFSASAGLSHSSLPLAGPHLAMHPCLSHKHIHTPDYWGDKMDPEDQETSTKWPNETMKCLIFYPDIFISKIPDFYLQKFL